MTACHEYRLYGISLRSEIQFPFPEQPIAEPDVTMRLESAAWFEHATAGASLSPASTDWYERFECQDGSELIRWPGLFEFVVSSDGRMVTGRALERARPESFQTYLLGQVLSLALVKQHQEPLHATAIAFDGTVVAFLGVSGQGKSTLAAACLRAGGRLLTDDLLVIRDIGGVLCGFSGPPRLKLFPEAAERFLPGEASLAPMNPDTSKVILALSPGATHANPAPIHAFFVLDGDEEASNVEVAPLTGVAGYLALLESTFNKRMADAARLCRQFVTLRETAARIPVKRLQYPWAIDRIDEVVRAIVADVKGAREQMG